MRALQKNCREIELKDKFSWMKKVFEIHAQYFQNIHFHNFAEDPL